MAVSLATQKQVEMSLILCIKEFPDRYLKDRLPRRYHCSSGCLGRDPTNDIFLPDPNLVVSGRHALIDVSGGDCILTDISTNGTFINDQTTPVGVGNSISLKHGDLIRVGEYVLEAEINRTVLRTPAKTSPVSRPSYREAKDVRPASDNRGLCETESQAADYSLLKTLLTAAGLDTQTQLSRKQAEEIGNMIRLATREIMNNLKVRTDVKEEFGVPLTRIRPSDNNPLKFSVNATEALRLLFAERPDGYLLGAAAYTESLEDFRIHEIATMTALRAAAHQLIEKFGPDSFGRELQSKNKRNNYLKAIRIKGLTKEYQDWFDGLARGGDLFQELFGKAFAQAYDEKVRRLKEMPGKSY